MSEEYKYAAFVSYSHRDRRWVSWLHPALERYKTPRALVGRATQRGGTVPASLFPVFGDRYELPTASDLAETIQTALRDSRYLVVICSPHSARSPWVDAEIRYFKSIGREGRILCLIVDGEPNAADKPDLQEQECFAPALRYRLSPDGRSDGERVEPLAADVRKDKDGRADAFLKIVAGLIGVNFAELKRRDLIRQRRRRLIWTSVAATLLVLMFGLLLIADRQRNEALMGQSRFLSRLALTEVGEGNATGAALLALRALPSNLRWPNRPFVPEAEYALERAAHRIQERSALTDGHIVMTVALSPDGRQILSGGMDPLVKLHDRQSGRLTRTLKGHTGGVLSAVYSPDGRMVATASLDGTVRLWDLASGAAKHQWQATCDSLAFAPDGMSLAAGCGDGKVLVWDVVSYQNTHVFPNPDAGESVLKKMDPVDAQLLRSREQDWGADIVTHVAFSPDAHKKQLLITHRTEAVLLDADSGDILRRFASDSPVWSAEFAPDGAHVVTAAKSGKAMICSVDDDDPCREQTLPFGLRLARYTSDASVAIAGETNSVVIWDLDSDSVNTALGGQEGYVDSLAYSRDGQIAVTASGEAGIIRVWDLAPHDVVRLAEPDRGLIEASALSPDGRTVLTGAQDGTLRLWDVAKETSQVLGKHEDAVAVAAWSGDGTKAVTGADQEVILWDIAARRPVKSLKLDRQVGTAMFAARANRLLTATDDGLRIWSTDDGKLLQDLKGRAYWQDQDGQAYLELNRNNPAVFARISDDNIIRMSMTPRMIGPTVAGAGHTGKIVSLVASSDQKTLASASEDGTARLWSIPEETLRAVLRGHRGPVRSVVFSPNDAVVATVSDDGTARLWDTRTGAAVGVLMGHTGPIRTAMFSEDGKTLVTTSDDHTARLWDLQTRTLRLTLSGHTGAVRAAAFCNREAELVTGSDDMTARVWNAQSGALISVLRGHSGPVGRISCGDDNSILTGSEDGTVRWWDMHSGAALAAPLQLGAPPRLIARFPCLHGMGRCIGGEADDGHILTWNAKTQQRDAESQMFSFKVSAAALSADGAYAAAGLEDGTLRLWDVSTGHQRDVLRGHENEVSMLAFAPDGGHLVSLSAESVQVWDVQQGRLVARLDSKPYAPNQSVAFAPTGLRLAVASAQGSVRLWDITSGHIETIVLGSAALTTVAFSRDGARLLASSRDGSVMIVDAHTGALIDRLEDSGGALASATLSRDGRTVITQPLNELDGDTQKLSGRAGDGIVRLWHLPPRCQDLISLAQRSVPRRLTKLERDLAFLPDEDQSDSLSSLYTVARPWFGWIMSGKGSSCQ